MDGTTTPKHELVGFTGVTPFRHKRYLMIPVFIFYFLKGIYPCNNKFTFTSDMNATSRGSVRIHRIRITEGPLESTPTAC